jgi:hypothetical protein
MDANYTAIVQHRGNWWRRGEWRASSTLENWRQPFPWPMS